MVPEWSDFVEFLLTMVEPLPEDHDRPHAPKLRGYLLRHPQWGVDAVIKREGESCYDRLAPLVVPPPPNVDMPVAPGARTILDSKVLRLQFFAVSVLNDWRIIRRWIEIWGPGGPMEIPADEYLDDPAFAEWWHKYDAG